MKSRLLTTFSLLLATNTAFSADVLPEKNFDIATPDLQKKQTQTPVAPKTNEPKTVNMTAEELIAQPELLTRVLDSQLMLGNADNVEFLLPLYKKIANPDPLLIAYSEAVVAENKGDMKTAIRLYREMLSQNPDLTPTRFRLAAALFADNQDEAADDQFKKIQADPKLPPEINALSEQYREALQKRQAWSFSGYFQYLQDNNINNAPKDREYNGWETAKPEKAHGVGYGVSVSKDTPLPNGHFWRITADADGEFYWDNHQYDELTVRVTTGGGHKNLRSEVAVLPFFEKKWYGGKTYAHTPGLRVAGKYNINANWQASAAAEYSRKKQKQYQYLNGDSYLTSATLLYMPNPQRYFVGGVDWSMETAEDKSDAYHRFGGRAGWGEEWGKGISTFLLLGAAHRTYHADAFLLDERRRNKEYTVNASVWLRNVHFYGITPRLTFRYQRFDSNHFAYDYQKAKAFIELSKTF